MDSRNINSLLLLMIIYIINLITCQVLDYSEKTWPQVCKLGKRNTPIDFPALNSGSYILNNQYIKLLSSNYRLTNGYSFSLYKDNKYYLKVENLGSLLIKKNQIIYQYDLADLHFHIASEHTFQGVAYDMELHLVHKKNTTYLTTNGIVNDPDIENAYLVVGILFKAGGTIRNPDIDLWDIQNFGKVNNLDLNPYVNPNKNFFHYLGGLTTPDCDEVVNWVVMEQVEMLTQDQFDVIKKWVNQVYPQGNARNVRPLNDRTIYYVRSIKFTSSSKFLNFSLNLIVGIFFLYF